MSLIGKINYQKITTINKGDGINQSIIKEKKTYGPLTTQQYELEEVNLSDVKCEACATTDADESYPIGKSSLVCFLFILLLVT